MPPKAARLPTPPPEPEPEEEYYEPEPADEVYYEEQEPTHEHTGLYAPNTCIKCHDFSAPDTHATFFPRSQVNSVAELSHELTSPFATETEKARAIFTWLHHNITYDVDAFFSGNLYPSTPDSTFRTGKGVCEGYAGLFKGLAEKAGLEVFVVSGHGKGFGYVPSGPDAAVPKMDSNHAWNAVLMDGEWHLIDSCWGAGALMGSEYKKLFSPHWFTSTPAEFGRRHFPTNTQFQLTEEPMDWASYILDPEGPVIFEDFSKLAYAPDLLQPSMKYLPSRQRVSFNIWKTCEHMSNSPTENYVLLLMCEGDQAVLEADESGGWSTTFYVPASGDVSLFYVKTVDGREAFGLGGDGFRKAKGKKRMEFGGLARWSIG